MTALASEKVAVVAAIDPISSASVQTSDWVAVKNWHQLLALIQVGVLGASATVDAKLQEATDGSGTGAQDISGKAITQLTKAGTDDNKQALIGLRADEVTAGYTHVALLITPGVASSLVAGAILGIEPRYSPANDLDVASVDEIVN